MNKRRLTKSNNRIFSGVLGGIADYFSVDPTLVRIIYTILSVCSTVFPGLVLYIVLSIIMPAPNSYRDNREDYSSKYQFDDMYSNRKQKKDDWSDF